MSAECVLPAFAKGYAHRVTAFGSTPGVRRTARWTRRWRSRGAPGRSRPPTEAGGHGFRLQAMSSKRARPGAVTGFDIPCSRRVTLAIVSRRPILNEDFPRRRCRPILLRARPEGIRRGSSVGSELVHEGSLFGRGHCHLHSRLELGHPRIARQFERKRSGLIRPKDLDGAEKVRSRNSPIVRGRVP